MIPISAVVLGAAEEQLVLDVLRSGQLAQGPMVARLESEFATCCGTTHAVAVANGTVALTAALRALGVGPGDEVVTSAFTFVATLNAILECGATPRFADIDPVTYNVDPESLERVCTERTRVVMPVHLYGQPADMTAIAKVAERAGASIVEDAAQAHGARVDGATVGGFGLATFSLYATKNITSGEGGVVTTNDDALADRLRLLRNHGMRARYEYELQGTNFRMTDVQAAIALPQLARLRETTARRQVNAAQLSEGLADLPGLITPVTTPGRDHVWHQYTVRITDDAPLDRDALAAALTDRGVQSGIYYPRVVFDYESYQQHPLVLAADVPHAREAARQVLSLPVHPHLSGDDLDRIVGAVRDAFGAQPARG
jgi:dTDP-4-amino-4,6-dideoxygalactose transaminase